MQAYLLPNGNLLIPRTAEDGDTIGDAAMEVAPDSKEGKAWLAWYAKRGEEPPKRPARRPSQEDDSSTE